MVRWILGILVIAIAAAIAAWWWLNRPLMIRHPAFGTDCSDLVSDANLNNKVDCVRVWYGTNRLLLTDEDTRNGDTVNVSAGLGESGDQLNLGRADVWLPKLIEQGGSRTRGDTPHVQGGAPDDANKLAEYVFLTRITANGRETFATTLQNAVDGDRSDSVLLFIHGFNVQFDEALVRAAQLSNDLSRENRFNVGIPVLYSWPSAGALSLEDYQGDRARSLSAAPYLEEFLDILTEDVSVSRINIIAHSMGNRVLTQALESYARDYLDRHDRNDLEFRIMLVAADVERDIFDAANGVFDNLDANVTIYTSDTDRALHISSIVNANQEKRLGDTDTNRPYIRSSLNYQTIDATAVTTELFGIGHNYYSDNPTILWDMMCTIRETPPQNRALEVARFADLPNGEQYFRINSTINPNASECTLHRSAFPAGGAPIPPRASDEPSVEDAVEEEVIITPEAAPAGPPRSMSPPPAQMPAPEPMMEPAPAPLAVNLLVDTYDTIDLAPQIESLRNTLLDGVEIRSIEIRAHTDTIGSSAENIARTQRYADAIADWYISQGIDAAIIDARGLGESDLAVQTADEIDTPVNRRVMIIVEYAN
ncbi:MAG: alpha/beta hydrolase [Pseudomonadota bacterium]